MPGVISPLVSALVARPSWLGVALSCLLSLTAPCDLSIVVQMFDGGGDPPLTSLCYSEVEEGGDREDDMLRPASSQDGRRFERKVVRAVPALPELPTGPLTAALSALPPGPHLAGSEHARRNGVGAPLLC